MNRCQDWCVHVAAQSNPGDAGGSHVLRCCQVNALTRRYTAFAASCLTLMADHDSDDSECLLFLQDAYMACAAVLLPDRDAV